MFELGCSSQKVAGGVNWSFVYAIQLNTFLWKDAIMFSVKQMFSHSPSSHRSTDIANNCHSWWYFKLLFTSRGLKYSQTKWFPVAVVTVRWERLKQESQSLTITVNSETPVDSPACIGFQMPTSQLPEWLEKPISLHFTFSRLSRTWFCFYRSE